MSGLFAVTVVTHANTSVKYDLGDSFADSCKITNIHNINRTTIMTQPSCNFHPLKIIEPKTDNIIILFFNGIHVEDNLPSD